MISYGSGEYFIHNVTMGYLLVVLFSVLISVMKNVEMSWLYSSEE